MVFSSLVNRFGGVTAFGGATDDYNPTLPTPVTQLLQLSNSEYEIERANRMALMWRYYRNTQYDPAYLGYRTDVMGNLVAASDELGAQLQAEKQLWSGVKPVFSVVPTSVDVDRRLCFKKARPLPVKNNQALEDRLTRKWEQDRWGRRIKLSPLYGAVMGASYLRVIPGVLDGNPTAPSRLAVYSPEVMTILRDQHNYSRVLAAKIEYKYSEAKTNPRNDIFGTLTNYQSIQFNNALGLTANEEVHTYTMIVIENAYYTFRDHKLYAYDTDLGNSWENTLGIVPVVEVPFNDIGEDIGLPTFASILPILDGLNELMSMAGTILKNTADPVLLAYGVSSSAKFEKKLQADGTSVWYLPYKMNFTGAAQQPPRVEYLEIKGGSIAPLIDFLDRVRLDVKAAMPEMQLEQSGNMSGSGHERELNLQGLVDKMLDIREMHFDGAEDALQMALVADDAKGRVMQPEEGKQRIEDARRKYDLTIWADTVLPRDRASESQTISVNIADGVLSRHTARLQLGMTYSEALEEQKRIKAEQDEEMAQMERTLAMQKKYAPAPSTVAKVPAKKPNATPPTRAGQPIPGAKTATRSQPNARPNNPNQK